MNVLLDKNSRSKIRIIFKYRKEVVRSIILLPESERSVKPTVFNFMTTRTNLLITSFTSGKVLSPYKVVSKL